MTRLLTRDEAPRLLRAIAAAIPFTGDPDRPTIAGIHLVERDGDLLVEATDAYSLVRVTLAGLGVEGLDIIIDVPEGLPTQAVPVDITLADGGVTFSWVNGDNRYEIGCDPIAGTYVNTDQFVAELDHYTPGIYDATAFNPEFLHRLAIALHGFASPDFTSIRLSGADFPDPLKGYARHGVDKIAVALMPVRLNQ